MRKKNYKGRCEKRKLLKCQEVVKTYDEIQYAYVDLLERNGAVKSYQCNVVLDGIEEDAYTSDFVCVKNDGYLMVRECVKREHISKPMTVKLLDMSRNYWLRRGITDWGIVTGDNIRVYTALNIMVLTPGADSKIIISCPFMPLRVVMSTVTA